MKRKENDLLRLTEETEEQEIEMGRRRNTQKKKTQNKERVEPPSGIAIHCEHTA